MVFGTRMTGPLLGSRLRAKGIEVIEANAVDRSLLQPMNVAGARWFISAIPNALERGSIIEEARALNPNLQIIARAHSDEEVEHLTQYGANLVIMGEREIARGITDYIVDQIKNSAAVIQETVAVSQAPAIETK